MRMRERVLDCGFGDLIENHALSPLGIQIQRVNQVPGDRLTLAVLVGGQIHRVRVLSDLLQLADDLPLVGEHFVDRLEGAVQIDPHFRGGKIAYVAHARHNRISSPQVPVDGSGLGR